MAIMDFFPQFGDNTDQTTDDATLAAINLKRKLALADSLRNAPIPQGQMVGNRYVAPSWTQYLAGAVSQGLSGMKEREAMKEYADLQKAEKSKLSKAFNEYITGKGPKDVITSQDNFVTQPLQEGQNVPTSPFKTNEQVGQVVPNYAGQAPVLNMSGDTTVNQPITSTTQVPRTKQELMANALKYINATGNTDLASKAVLGDIENMFKAPETNLGKVEIKDYTPASIAKFKETGNYNDLVQIVKSDRTTLSNVGKLTSELNDIMAANPKDPRIPFYKNAIQKETTYKDESNKAPAGYVWGKPDASGNPTLIPLAGGPADKAVNPTEQQANAYTFSNRMEKADKILNDLEGKYNPLAISAKSSAIVSNIPGAQTVINARMSPETQKAEQAQRDFVNAVLRRESGSAISQSEFDNARIQYFPQTGDSPDVLAQKAQNRKTAIEGIKRAAGSMNKPTSNVVDWKDL
jgi:hypothetical protein